MKLEATHQRYNTLTSSFLQGHRCLCLSSSLFPSQSSEENLILDWVRQKIEPSSQVRNSLCDDTDVSWRSTSVPLMWGHQIQDKKCQISETDRISQMSFLQSLNRRCSRGFDPLNAAKISPEFFNLEFDWSIVSFAVDAPSHQFYLQCKGNWMVR